MNFNTYIRRFLKKIGLTTIERPRDPFTDMHKILSYYNINTIIDGGAYHGLVSKHFSSLFPNAKIYAFEPLNESYAILEQNVKDTPHIRPISIGLSSVSGKKPLYATEQRYCSSLSPRNSFGEKYYPEATRLHNIQMIDVVTLDEWAKDSGVEDIDIIKLDLQGHELEALKGASNILKQSIVKVIYTEIEFVALYENNCLFFEVESFLSQYGFKVYYLYDLQSSEDGQLIYGDALFIHRNHVKLDQI